MDTHACAGPFPHTCPRLDIEVNLDMPNSSKSLTEQLFSATVSHVPVCLHL